MGLAGRRARRVLFTVLLALVAGLGRGAAGEVGQMRRQDEGGKQKAGQLECVHA